MSVGNNGKREKNCLLSKFFAAHTRDNVSLSMIPEYCASPSAAHVFLPDNALFTMKKGFCV